ncbi:tannase/feruloyl esterase family alpha/beta hydrolase [Lysobacter sp. CA199]|uniref:tannase/feruloyl esterase family alpha/beta hydrolase n=1 Tax=Lysobacter sp. CA199 TaxID=3455608 RepID=UPI003F8D2D0D
MTRTRRVEAIAGISTSGFCQVFGTRLPYLDIEVDVPDNWSGRLFHQGGGGFDGFIFSAVTTDPTGAVIALSPMLTVQRGVYAASNGGNRAFVPAQAAPGVWANGTAEGRVSATDYAYAALGTTVGFAKAVTQMFFGARPRFTYFNGCSNGGREAYKVAERWPGQYDGIVSGCETQNMGTAIPALLQLSKTLATPAALSAAQYRAAYASAVAACDARDGASDGYLANPASCDFEPALLSCGLPTANSDPGLCLSIAQVRTLKGLLSPLRLPDGGVLYSGYRWTDFSRWLAGGFYNDLGGGYAFLATGDRAWLTQAQQARFDLARDYPLIRNGLRQAGVDNDNAAIAAYVASGKKLISWHDGGDPLLSAPDHYRNHQAMIGAAKASRAGDPAANTRFFLVPGNDHGAGSALTQIDWAGAIVDWVEKGVAPTRLTYTFIQPGSTAPRSLPVCLYPQYPRYDGRGDISAAASYTCTY